MSAKYIIRACVFIDFHVLLCLQMIDAGRVFIIDYKLLHGLSDVEDYTERNTTDRREMAASRSPFCTFVTANVGGSKELKPVAIQTDLIKGDPSFGHAYCCKMNIPFITD